MSVKRIFATTFVDAGEDWNVSHRVAVTIFFAPCLAFIAAVILRFADRANWSFYWQEGGPVEWMQFLFLVVATFFSLSISKKMFAERSWALAVLYSALALGLFFVAGEEIIWGQTLLEYGTPLALAQTNYKSEMSLHNVSSLVSWFDIGKLLIGAYGSFAALGLIWLHQRVDVKWMSLVVPPLFLISPFVIMLVQRLLRFTLMSDDVPVGYGEFEELCFYYGMMVFTWLVWRRVRPREAFELPAR